MMRSQRKQEPTGNKKKGKTWEDLEDASLRLSNVHASISGRLGLWYKDDTHSSQSPPTLAGSFQ